MTLVANTLGKRLKLLPLIANARLLQAILALSLVDRCIRRSSANSPRLGRFFSEGRKESSLSDVIAEFAACLPLAQKL